MASLGPKNVLISIMIFLLIGAHLDIADDIDMAVSAILMWIGILILMLEVVLMVMLVSNIDITMILVIWH